MLRLKSSKLQKREEKLTERQLEIKKKLLIMPKQKVVKDLFSLTHTTLREITISQNFRTLRNSLRSWKSLEWSRKILMLEWPRRIKSYLQKKSICKKEESNLEEENQKKKKRNLQRRKRMTNMELCTEMKNEICKSSLCRLEWIFET